MTLDQIKTFLWVARLGGFRRAAERLNLSQPAISTRIANLEDQLGVPLIERGAKGLVLTRHGEMLKAHAEQMLFVEDEIRHRVASPEGIGGLLRIGASETIAQSWLPALLRALTDAFPRISVDLTVDISAELRDRLLGRQLDLAFLMGPVSEFSVDNVALPAFQLTWYKAAGSGDVDFRRVPVISFPARTRPYRELSAELSRRYGPGVRLYGSASLSASLQMIAEGVGVGPYPAVLARRLLNDGRIAAFDPGIPVRPLEFTASFLSEPSGHLAAEGARLARRVADGWSGTMSA